MSKFICPCCQWNRDEPGLRLQLRCSPAVTVMTSGTRATGVITNTLCRPTRAYLPKAVGVLAPDLHFLACATGCSLIFFV